MNTRSLRTVVMCLATAAIVTFSPLATEEDKERTQPMIPLDYLEIVTPALDETVELLSKTHGVTFGEPSVALGGARTAQLAGGGRISVRKPMHDAEEPTVRPYLRVDDIDAAFEQAKTAGAEIMMPPTDIEDGARFCIYNLGGIQHGIWQR